MKIQSQIVLANLTNKVGYLFRTIENVLLKILQEKFLKKNFKLVVNILHFLKVASYVIYNFFNQDQS